MPLIFGIWMFFVLYVALIQMQSLWQKVKLSTGPRPLCWQPDWDVWSQPLSASPRAGRSSKSTRLSLSPSRPWYCLLHSARYPPHSTTLSTPRWLLRLNGNKGLNTGRIILWLQNKNGSLWFCQKGYQTCTFFTFLRWTRREEADFYRVVSTFGVVFDPNLSRFDWTKFRAMARLHKKTDESLQKYLCAFTAMCRRVCRLPPKEGGQSICLFTHENIQTNCIYLYTLDVKRSFKMMLITFHVVLYVLHSCTGCEWFYSGERSVAP